jgi:hypothetical protein
MAEKKALVLGMLGALEQNISDKGLNNRKELSGFVISHEGMDTPTREGHEVNLNTLNSTVNDTLSMILSSEDFEGITFSDAQLNAARSIAALALDPSTARSSLDNLKPVSFKGQGSTISAATLGVEDIVDTATLAVEAYDGQATNNAIYFSIVHSLMAATQDKFGEAFFPTIAIDPVVAGANIECEYTSLYNEITRSVDGSPDAGKFKKTPIVKAVYDNDLFGTDRNKCTPVARAENAAVILKDVHSFVVNNGSEDITTAPIAFGKSVSLLGVSQTDGQLAKGVMDNTDALDRRLVLDKIYLGLTGDDDGDTNTPAVTKYFSHAVSMLPHANFTYSTQDQNKDLSLTFNSKHITLVTGVSKTVTGAASGVLAQLPANHTVKLGVVLHGDANTQSGDIQVFASSVQIVEIRDAAGSVLPTTNSDYVAIAAVIAGIKLEGYTVEAYRTNSNMRTRGQLITTDRYNQIYTVPLRTGITVLAPLNNATGSDNDAARLTSQITYAGIKTSIDAVKTLVEFADMLNNVTNNGVDSNVELMGVGRHYVDAYYKEIALDVSANVDSIKSKDRQADIRAVLVNKIKDAVINMGTMSNYNIAHGIVGGQMGGKISVTIGTDPKTAQYLTGGESTIDLGDDYEAIVVSTPNVLMRNKIMVTFGIYGSDRNTKANPLNFGQCFWSPTITTDVVRTVNGSTSREMTNSPRYLHVVNLPVLTQFTVSDIDTALGKVTQNTANV